MLGTRLKKRLGKIGFLFSLPAVFFFVLFISIPIFFTVFLTFAGWKGFDISQIRIVGLKNYGAIFTDRIFWLSFLHTSIFVACTTVFLNLFGFTGALIIDTKVQGTRFLKNAIFLPVLLSPIIIGIMWSRMLDAFGVVNKLMQALRLTTLPILFLGSKDLALYTIIIATIWQYTGYDMLLYYAGLQGVPNELLEAARIDGAGGFRVVRSVILPVLSPVVAITTLLNIIGGYKIFDVVYVMTKGGPNHHTEVFATYLFLQAFRFNDMGVASVIAIVIVLISLVASIVRMRITSREV
jgi:raffinose/stachyose/melibiose transport system permease protein